MKKLSLIIVSSVLTLLPCLGQSSVNYLQYYLTLVSRVGVDGVGVETLLDKWYASDSTDVNQMVARFNYFYKKNSRDSVVVKESRTYLGQEPILSLKDSTGRVMNYFNETVFDDQMFGKCLTAIDGAIALKDTRIDLREQKVDALINYEKENPDMTLECLKSLIDYNFTAKPKWVDLEGNEEAADYFDQSIQNYCFALSKIASPSSYEAFRIISEKMLKYEPQNVNFIDNMGAYAVLVKKNDKQALKMFKKALKIKPDDSTALQNVRLIEKRMALKKSSKK